jgi:mannose-1-phosphate guanylyltransferase
MHLFAGRSLLRHAYERLAEGFEPSRIYVLTGEGHLPLIQEELPELPPKNLVGEPAVRDTANAVCLAACLLEARDPDGVMGIFTADHLISPTDRFLAAVDQACAWAAANGDALITLGLTPQWAATGYGYVQRGPEVSAGLYEVAQFKEKPDRATAERYVAEGGYYWNSGMFVWSVRAIIDELTRHLPASVDALRPVAQAWGRPEGRELLAKNYPGLQKISIDYAVMEKARRVLLIELDCDWLDVGSWTALAGAFQPDDAGNTAVAERTLLLDSANSILVSEGNHLLATIGVQDLIVVHSPDATLICRRRDAERLKVLVERLKEAYGEQYL